MSACFLQPLKICLLNVCHYNPIVQPPHVGLIHHIQSFTEYDFILNIGLWTNYFIFNKVIYSYFSLFLEAPQNH